MSDAQISIRRFNGQVIDIFGSQNIVCAFIGGSFAAGRATPKSDIDVFICLRKAADKKQKLQFAKLYYDLHAELKLFPDSDYPGEVMSIKRLKSALTRASDFLPASRLRDLAAYDGLVWAGMLVCPKQIIRQDTDLSRELEATAKTVLSHWYFQMARGMNYVEKEPSKMGLFLKEAVVYEPYAV
jgi:predicted nucleotidyltransferase